MNGLNYAYKILNLLESSIMPFIKFVQNCNFARRNLLKWKRLKRPYPLCFRPIGSSSNSIVHANSIDIPILSMFYFKPKSMMNF